MTLADLYYYTGGSSPPPSTYVADMAPAIRGPIAYGPRVSQAGTVIPPLVATLYRRADLNDPVVTFDQSFGRKWQDQLNESGSASLDLLNDDPDLAELGGGGFDVVRFEVHGYAAFTWLVRQIDKVAIAEGEEHDQITTLSGPGHVAIFDEALVYPARGPGVKPPEEDRIFSWPSVDYNDSWWGYATVMAYAGSVPPENEGWWNTVFDSGDFPDPSAAWIWSHDATVTHSPRKGACYVRKEFTLPVGGDITFLCTIDNGGDVYLDGQLLPSLSGMEDLTSVYTAQIEMTAGVHNLAIVGYEPAFVEEGTTIDPAGILLTAYYTDGNGELIGTPAVHTDATWKIVEFPPSPPGMTPGEVVRHCIEEARARGCLPPIEYHFTDEVDASGAPWPVVTDIATKTGTDVLTFFRELSATYIDFWLEPGSWRLWVWAKDKRGDTKNVVLRAVTDPLDPWSGNLAGLTHKQAL